MTLDTNKNIDKKNCLLYKIFISFFHKYEEFSHINVENGGFFDDDKHDINQKINP